jgi:hypothetical protein
MADDEVAELLGKRTVGFRLFLTPAERTRWHAIADHHGIPLAQLVRVSVESMIKRLEAADSQSR